MSKTANTVTKDYLDKKLEDTKVYLDNKLEDTKVYLDNKLEATKVYLDDKLEAAKKDADKKFELFEKRIVAKMTEIQLVVLKELHDMREENEVHQFSHSRINDELDEYASRIKKLERA